MKSIKQITLHGLQWSFIDSIIGHGSQFIFGIFLARILSPEEFGLIGMLSIVISISQIFVDSGFASALIRKKKCTPQDYSTVFVYNLIISVTIYILLFFLSEKISIYFSEPQLNHLLKILGFVLLISPFSVIHRSILNKNIDFKTQSKISLVSSIGSGFISISMALNGFGVWSLVLLIISRSLISTILFWILIKWEFSINFSWLSFNDLFGFGGKLLLSGLINTIYVNIYSVIIGKYFSAFQLGQYTKAEQFSNLPSQSLNSIIDRVSYPVLVALQEDKLKLKTAYKNIIRKTMFVTFFFMLTLSAISYPLIYSLIGLKWKFAAEYLQIFCFIGMLYPLHSLNLNMLKVEGRSDLFLKLEIIKKVIALPIIFVGYFFGIKIMLLGMLINSFFAYYLNSYWSGRFINYSMKEQIVDILPGFFFAVSISLIVYLVSIIFEFDNINMLIIQLFTSVSLFFSLGELFNFKDYIEIKKLFFDNLKYPKSINNL